MIDFILDPVCLVYVFESLPFSPSYRGSGGDGRMTLCIMKQTAPDGPLFPLAQSDKDLSF
jgi:hypothetical protein